MEKREIYLTAEFKRQTVKAISSILFFVVIYLVILMLCLILTALCITGGIFIIAIKPMLVTIALGIGLASMGFLILIFLLKFIFKSHKVDRSQLFEISKTNEPDLFRLIDDIIQEVGTSRPKNVYLSTEVNASVFYDSSFWSMFFPVEKNLQIGLGLVNTITKAELKAILSHEFGHFSQRTMKVGSYVYNVNQVIFNMLYDNESYEKIIQKWASVSGYFSIFVAIAIKINERIQWVLKKLNEIVNKSYLGLSREMEFHADEIAASVTGYEPLKNALLRMSLADNSFNYVLNFYQEKIQDNIKSENLYRDQAAVIKVIAEINNFPLKHELPEISLEEHNKFDKSKLVIKDQWASHPTIKERIQRLEKTNFSSPPSADTLANTVFRNLEETQKQFTIKMFESVNYRGETKLISDDKFQNEYRRVVWSNSFSRIYNGYYDHKNPSHIELTGLPAPDLTMELKDLFSDHQVNLVYSALALQNDVEQLTNISNNRLLIKSFDYDGVRYKKKEAGGLIKKLSSELETVNEEIKKNDSRIYEFFRKAEHRSNGPTELEHLYSGFFEFDNSFEAKYDLYQKLLNELQFVHTTTPYEQISSNLEKNKPLEESLKKEISTLLADQVLQSEITNDIKQNLEQYISKSLEYFDGTNYAEDNLNVLFNALHNYSYLLSRAFFLRKKKLLTYQENLLRIPLYTDVSQVKGSGESGIL